MRTVAAEPSTYSETCKFAEWLLVLGENKLPQIEEPDYVRCPQPMIVLEHILSGLINAIYRRITNVGLNAHEYFNGRAIFGAHMNIVAFINAARLNKLQARSTSFTLRIRLMMTETPVQFRSSTSTTLKLVNGRYITCR